MIRLIIFSSRPGDCAQLLLWLVPELQVKAHSNGATTSIFLTQAMGSMTTNGSVGAYPLLAQTLASMTSTVTKTSMTRSFFDPVAPCEWTFLQKHHNSVAILWNLLFVQWKTTTISYHKYFSLVNESMSSVKKNKVLLANLTWCWSSTCLVCDTNSCTFVPKEIKTVPDPHVGIYVFIYFISTMIDIIS